MLYLATRKVDLGGTYYRTEEYTLCATCAKLAETCDPPYLVRGDAYYEGPPVECDECGHEIESAYGDPDEDKDLDKEQES